MTEDIEVLYEDAALFAVNKPSGISLFADRGSDAQWWPQLQARFPNVRPVHRLDKGTSGVLLLARTTAMQGYLNRLFQQSGVRKFYIARVTGNWAAAAWSGDRSTPATSAAIAS